MPRVLENANGAAGLFRRATASARLEQRLLLALIRSVTPAAAVLPQSGKRRHGLGGITFLERVGQRCREAAHVVGGFLEACWIGPDLVERLRFARLRVGPLREHGRDGARRKRESACRAFD